MECGADELACQLVDWVSANDFIVRQFLELYDTAWNQAGSTIVKFLREHGEKLIAAVSATFAIWRWWRYREGILHKRLLEYIHESDARLGPTSSQVREVILRPGRTAALPLPAFAVELCNVLDNNGWHSYFRFGSLERQTERKLSRILKGIHQRQRIVKAASQSLQKQRAQVHLLAGTVAAARAARRYDPADASRDDHRALRQFREALQSPGHTRDVFAKECEAFQLLRTGERESAYRVYVELQELALEIADEKTRDLVIARSKRFRAQINQAEAGNAPSRNAWTQDDGGIIEALRLRELHRPYTEWGAIEQAEMHYVAAYVASRFNNWVHDQPMHLARSEEAYLRVRSDDLPRRRFFLSAWQRRLLDETEAGLRRVERAKTGDYDLGWLMV